MATQIGRLAVPHLDGASLDHAVDAVVDHAKRALSSARGGAKSVGKSVKNVAPGSLLRGVIFAAAALIGVGAWLVRRMRRGKLAAKPLAQVAAPAQRAATPADGEHHLKSKARSKSKAQPAPALSRGKSHARRAAKR